MTKLKVGITGGIGSGKSFCARYFQALGIPLYSADDRAKELMRTDRSIKSHLTALLGEDAYLTSGELNKPFLRQQLFGNADIRKQIDAIVHPAVGKDYEQWHAAQHTPFTLKEAALLVESGSYKELDHLIMVKAPAELRFQRIMQRDKIGMEEVHKRIQSQWPEEKKSEAADYFIDNSGLFPLLPQIIGLYKEIISQA